MTGRIALRRIKKHWQLYLVIFLPMMYIVIFKYMPMFGIVIAFQKFNAIEGFLNSPWVGFDNFKRFITSANFWNILKNTFSISFYGLIVGFPMPIILALALNEIRNGKFKRSVQLLTYAPYFISTVVMVSIIMLFLNPRFGFYSFITDLFQMEKLNLLGFPKYFSSIFVWSEVWQKTGYAAIIYMAALAGISPELYEAARVDGASRFRKIFHIDLPGILPVAVVLLILNVGELLSISFEKIFLLQNPLNLETSEVISTYVYKMGLLGTDYSYSAAIGLFNSVVNLILLVLVNYIARKVSENSLW